MWWSGDRFEELSVMLPNRYGATQVIWVSPEILTAQQTEGMSDLEMSAFPPEVGFAHDHRSDGTPARYKVRLGRLSPLARAHAIAVS
jgi:hypothetical protein